MADTSLSRAEHEHNKQHILKLILTSVILSVVVFPVIYMTIYWELSFEYVGTISTYEKYRKLDGTYAYSDNERSSVWTFYDQPSKDGYMYYRTYSQVPREIPVDFDRYGYMLVYGYQLDHVYINRFLKAHGNTYQAVVVLNDDCPPNTISIYREKKDEDYVCITPVWRGDSKLVIYKIRNDPSKN